MAKDNPRVHKANEVHKRRAPKKLRAKTSANAKSAEVKAAADAVKVMDAKVSTDTVKPAEIAKPTEETSPHVISSEANEVSEVEKSSTPQEENSPNKEPFTGILKSEPSTKPSTESTSEESTLEPSKPKKRWGLRIAIIFTCLIIAAALIAAGFYAGSRWLRYNDEHSIEGTWYVEGTDVPLAFRDGKILLNASTSYDYAINSIDKTITYSLGSLAGQGRYWFSPDRGTLIITDGADYSMWSTFFEDFGYDMSCLFGNKNLPVRDGSIVLTHAITLSKPQANVADEGQNVEGESVVGESTEDENIPGETTETQVPEDSSEHHSRDNFSELSFSDVLMRET